MNTITLLPHLILISSFICGSAMAKIQKPNIVLMFIDDMGYGDIGPFGNKINQTPNLDRMAEEGNVLTQFYVANTACTPSRAALLTGSYAHRIGMDSGAPNFVVNFPGDKRGLNPSEITIAEMLKENGYVTGCFGKWHLGDQPEFMPLAQGFDTYFGIPYSNDMWPGNKRGNPVTKGGPYEPLPIMLQDQAVAHVADDLDQALLAEVITDQAIKFIRKNKSQPFFCFIPHSHVHSPRFARPKFLQRAEGNVNRAHVEEVDDSIGRVLNTIRNLKLDKNTLVIFTSDNGGMVKATENRPLRSYKGDLYEGGIRVPCIIDWPGVTKPGSVSAAPIHGVDFVATLLAMASLPQQPENHQDSVNLIPLLRGKSDFERGPMVWHYPVGVPQIPHSKPGSAIRIADWKYLRFYEDGREELFNLRDDIGETRNLTLSKPEKAVEMRSRLDAILKEHGATIPIVGPMQN